jgi:hypothetical protein
VTAALAGALRACAADLYCEEAAAELLIGHGTFLRRADFAACICEGTSIAGGTTLMASIGRDAADAALRTGNLPASSGERSILELAASIASGTPVSLRDTVTSLDDANLEFLITAIRHAAGHRPS